MKNILVFFCVWMGLCGVCSGDQFYAVLEPNDPRASKYELNIQDDTILLEPENYDLSSVAWISTKAMNSMEEDPSLFKNVDKIISTKNTETNIHTHISNIVFGSVEITAKMQVEAIGGGVGITFLSDYPNSDKYYRVRGYTSDQMHVAPRPFTEWEKHFNFSGQTMSEFTPKPGVWFQAKIRVIVEPEKTVIQAMFWEDGTHQPFNWQVDCYDDSPNRYKTGAIGLWSGGSGGKKFADIKISKLIFQSPGKIIGLNKFLFERDMDSGIYTIKARALSEYGNLSSEYSEPYMWEYEKQEEIVLEITRPTIIKINVK